MSIADILAPAPTRNMAPAVFIAAADAFVASLLPFAEELEALGTAYALSVNTVSTTSLTNDTSGNKTLTVEADKGFVPGMCVTVAYTTTPTIQMVGIVVSYTGTTLVVSPSTSAGASGPYTAWTISQTAVVSANLSTAAVVAKGNSGTGTVTFVVSAGEVQTLTNNGAHTWAFTWPSGFSEIEIIVTNAGVNAITLPTINWFKGDGTKSTTFSTMGVTLQASGVNTFLIWTPDGGTTVYGKAT